MIASHNSWTFAKPIRWWMWAVAPFSRCQAKSIQEQADSGVVMLDLRLKLHNNTMYAAHGAYITERTYTRAFSDICMTLPKYVRVFMESRHPSNAEIRLFQDCCYELQRSFPEVTFVGGHGAHEPNWNVQYFDFGTTEPYYTEYHASVMDGIFPRLWAYRHREDIESMRKDTERIYMVDFV